MKKTILIMLLLVLFSSCCHAESNDRDASQWAKDDIDLLMETELISPAFNYRLQDSITRNDFVYLAVRIYEINKAELIATDPDISFTDTNDLYALKAATVGISSGIGGGKFGPDELLTREQLATLIINTLKLIDFDLLPSENLLFADDELVSDWAQESIYQAKSNGIISGIGNNEVDPKGVASREVALVITKRILFKNEMLSQKFSEVPRIFINYRDKSYINSDFVHNQYFISDDGCLYTDDLDLLINLLKLYKKDFSRTSVKIINIADAYNNQLTFSDPVDYVTTKTENVSINGNMMDQVTTVHVHHNEIALEYAYHSLNDSYDAPYEIRKNAIQKVMTNTASDRWGTTDILYSADDFLSYFGIERFYECTEIENSDNLTLEMIN